jgi:uncharacterized repeat protein (TIGR01451 family)
MRLRVFLTGCLIYFFISLGVLSARDSEVTSLKKQTTVGRSSQPSFIENLLLSDEGLSFVLNTPGFSVDKGGRVTAGGLTEWTQESGSPELPFYKTFIVLPPGAIAKVIVREVDVSLKDTPYVAPVATAYLQVDDEASDVNLINDFTAGLVSGNVALDEIHFGVIYAKDAYYPATVYTIGEPVYYRDVRLAELTLYPLRYNPVTKKAQLIRHMEVALYYDRQVDEERLSQPPFKEEHAQILNGLTLNSGQISGWRHLPAAFQPLVQSAQVGADSYKIELNQDGIYELTYEQLAAVGMDVDNVNPHGFAISYRGEPIAYQFVGDTDNDFEPDEKIRFFGWKFRGHRLDKEYVKNNVYWLHTNSQATIVNSVTPQSDFPVAEYFTSTVTQEPEVWWFSGFTDQWDTFANEPDAWYWDRMQKASSAYFTKTYTVTLPYPASEGGPAQFTAEFNSMARVVVGGVEQPHMMHVYMNNYPDYGSQSWYGIQNANVYGSVPANVVLHGANPFQVVMATNASTTVRMYVNRISVTYARQFITTDDQLTFTDADGGQREFNVQGFTQNNPDNMFVWNVTNPNLPVQVALTAANITGANPYTYTFGSDHPANTTFVASSVVLTPALITQYIAPDLEPLGNGAEWIAISHQDFITETLRLAQHRAIPENGGLSTHVVDIADVVNQFGHGLPLPAAIRNYLTHALATWEVPPRYVLLVGDATTDPRNVAWPEPQYVPTDLVFKDRWNGQIPSDATFVTLIGNDLLPDLAIGRLTVQTITQTASLVDKIILYEANLSSTDNWGTVSLFVSDRPDTTAGDFCQMSQQSASHLPASLSRQHLCLPSGANASDATALRTQMFNEVNAVNAGVLLLNYRGHGAPSSWGGSPQILSTAHAASWDNADKPVVILSLDCLDGFFALPYQQGLAETFLRQIGTGTAAHWSSTGLGTTGEHSVLHRHFLQGIFDHGLTTMGDAANYAKIRYALANMHSSNLYSFTLQGDPAMIIMKPDLRLEKSALQPVANPGDQIQFVLEVANDGLYPALTTITDTLPAGMSYVSAQSSVPATVSQSGNDVIFELDYAGAPNKGLPAGATATITLTAVINPLFPGGSLTNTAVAASPGIDLAPADNSATAFITVNTPAATATPIRPDYRLFLPNVIN